MLRLGWLAMFLAATNVLAQTPPRALPASRDRAITFSDAKPVLGLPPDAKRPQGICSSDGLTYFEASANASGTARVVDLYSVATSGNVRHLRQTVPIEFTNVFSRDFFPGDAALVTLISAEKRDGGDPDGRLQDRQYFLSVSDHDGDGSKLLALNLPFTPLKVAQFGSGEFAVLGWEPANQQVKLVVLKEDGTLLRFFDPNERRSEPATLASLSGAAFVPFGRGILLTYPGTVKPIRMLSATGQDLPISLDFPAGYRLHDVLNSGGPNTIVARVQEMAEPEPAGDGEGTTPPRQRLFEFQWPTGKRLREFTLDNIPLSAVTCAANHSLGAIFLQPEVSPADPATEAPARQWLVSTVRPQNRSMSTPVVIECNASGFYVLTLSFRERRGSIRKERPFTTSTYRSLAVHLFETSATPRSSKGVTSVRYPFVSTAEDTIAAPFFLLQNLNRLESERIL